MAGQSTIVVVGSSNTDMVIKTSRLPIPGETILGGNFFLFPGGKGANQAVAAARLGASVTFVGKIGDDIFGHKTLATFREENLNTDFVIVDKNNPTGTALITVDEKGENTIVVAQGANAKLMAADITNALPAFQNSQIVLVQLEIPIETVVATASTASSLGKKVILNPAPSAMLPDSLFKYLFAITPNQSEAGALTGVTISDHQGVKKAAEHLYSKGVKNVVVTLGKSGAYFFDGANAELIPGKQVTAIDTTAAGDVFNGAMAVALGEGAAIKEAIAFANHAAAISVTRMGAQSSAPYRNELKQLTTLT